MFSLIVIPYTPFVPFREPTSVWGCCKDSGNVCRRYWKLKYQAILEMVVENVESMNNLKKKIHGVFNK